MSQGYGNPQSTPQTASTPTITFGITPPEGAPAKVGDIYIDTSQSALYFAKGTADSNDWIQVANA